MRVFDAGVIPCWNHHFKEGTMIHHTRCCVHSIRPANHNQSAWFPQELRKRLNCRIRDYDEGDGCYNFTSYRTIFVIVLIF